MVVALNVIPVPGKPLVLLVLLVLRLPLAFTDATCGRRRVRSLKLGCQPDWGGCTIVVVGGSFTASRIATASSLRNCRRSMNGRTFAERLSLRELRLRRLRCCLMSHAAAVAHSCRRPGRSSATPRLSDRSAGVTKDQSPGCTKAITLKWVPFRTSRPRMLSIQLSDEFERETF